jgi:hypothetical protein
MQRRLARLKIGAAWLGSAMAAFLASHAAADTRALRHSEGAPVRINGYVSAGAEAPSIEALRNGPSKLRRDAFQGSAPSRPPEAGSFFLDVSHDDTR